MVNILLAEDHHLVREGIRSLLEKQSDMFIVGEVENGLHVVDAVEKLKPDILIADLAMPGLNGLEATRQVVDRFANVQVIILSMYATEAYVVQALANGARGYVVKDSTISDLVDAIAAVCAGNYYLSAPLAEKGIQAYLGMVDAAMLDSYSNLTPREREIFQLVAEGHTSSRIGDILSISSRTVEVHRANIMRKLNLRTHTDLVRYAIRKGIIMEDDALLS